MEAQMAINIIARFLSIVTTLYSLLCIVRVFLTWIPNQGMRSRNNWLARITDPYLDFFSRLSFFRAERLDFSPIAALAVLSVASMTFATIATTGFVTLGFILSLLLQAAWSVVAFLLSFYAVCAMVRLIGYTARLGRLKPLWDILDIALNRVLYRINHFIYRRKAVTYLQGLITGAVVLVVLRVAGGLLIKVLSSLLVSLPF